MFYVIGQDIKDRKIAFEKIILREINQGIVKVPSFVLAHDHFDDFTYKTSFRLYYVEGAKKEEFKVIGDLKILKKGERITVLKSFEESLSQDYCSVGDSLEYYLNLKQMGENVFKKVVNTLNDVFIHEDILNTFRDEPGFEKSLMRSSSTRSLIENRNEYLNQLESFLYKSVNSNTGLKFSFGMMFPASSERTMATFNFSDHIYGRINVIIGKNGSGKSTFLSSLGLKLSHNDTRFGNLSPDRLDIRRVVLVSYSMFDSFERLQELNSKSYILCGFIDKSRVEIEKRYLISSVKQDFEGFMMSPKFDFLMLNNKAILKKLFRPLVDDTVESLSSGQLIIMKIVLDIVNNIQERSMVLIDEIENHLHPNYVIELLKILAFLLGEFNSFCILTTHSPLVVQQIDLNAVHVFDREGSITRVRNKRTNYLAMNLDSITEDVFGLKPEDNIYFDILKSYPKDNASDVIFNQLAKSLMNL